MEHIGTSNIVSEAYVNMPRPEPNFPSDQSLQEGYRSIVLLFKRNVPEDVNLTLSPAAVIFQDLQLNENFI